tara:strand:- start:725 stop:2017 length:1293 start_codon:yes stop_codon:yes gene_type:complete
MDRDKSNKSDLINILEKRGFVHQITEKNTLDELLAKSQISIYSGFDATGSSLHVGHLLPIMILRWAQKTNHKPIILLGGGTTKVGDPSGKDKSRKILDDKIIDENILSIKNIFSKFLDFSAKDNKAILVNNNEWLKKINYINFLRDIGKHFSINRMLTMESVKQRLERQQPLSFLEFNYMVLQAYDFYHLNKKHKCLMQVGGSDQWGNIVMGIDLGRRLSGVELYGLTCPLLTTASGQKMGKTEKGAVWLDNNKLSAFEYYQFWRNTEDPDVIKFLKLFTDLPLDEINELSKLKGKDLNHAKIKLAYHCTKILHGEEASNNAKKTAMETYDAKGTGTDLPRIKTSRHSLSLGLSIVEALTTPFESSSANTLSLCKSKGEAKRLIKQGGARVNNKKILDENYKLTIADFNQGEAKISHGSKKHARLVINDL